MTMDSILWRRGALYLGLVLPLYLLWRFSNRLDAAFLHYPHNVIEGQDQQDSTILIPYCHGTGELSDSVSRSLRQG